MKTGFSCLGHDYEVFMPCFHAHTALVELCVLTTELCVSCGRDYRARFVGLFVGGWVDRTLRVITPF